MHLETVDDWSEAIDLTIAHTQDRKLLTRWGYYSGIQPKIYLTPKLAETFRALADSLTENYCGLAVNSRIHRLELLQFEGTGAMDADKMWTDGGYPLRQDSFYRWALVHGQAYLAVNEDGIYANPATTMYAHPDPDDWMKSSWAGKLYVEGDKWKVTIWDESVVRRYKAKGPGRKNALVTGQAPGADDFILEEEEPHGFDRVPVIGVNPYGYLGSPLMDQISPIQDRINKITANKLVAAEFGAFKQRIFFTRQQLTPEAIRQQPDTAIVLDPGDSDAKASVQEMGATDLRNYDDSKNNEVDSLFTIASLPRHLRVNVATGSNASGIAIKADEGPFTEAIFDHQREFGQAFTQAFEMLGIEAFAEWKSPVVNDDLENAEILATLVAAGVPWQAAAQKYLHWTNDEVAEATLLKGTEQVGAASQMAQQTAAFLSNPTLTEPNVG